MSKKLFLFGLAAAMATAIACGSGEKSPSPVSPSAGGSVDGADAGPDGENLKLTAPTPVAPANGSTLETVAPVLSVTGSQPKYQGSGPATPSHRFQLLNGSTVVREFRTAGTTWTPTNMEPKTTYGWRVRGEMANMFGPWSPTWTFTTAEQPEGYVRSGELYDPLVDGKSVGQVAGSVTFVPGVGARLNGHTSHIRYELPQTVADGEFSVLVTGVLDNTEGGKTKIMSMCQAPCVGANNLTVNDRRFTLERRGNPKGIVAWRMISHRDQIDTGPEQRRYVRFTPDQVYLVNAAWRGNVLTITMREGGASGQEIYRESEPFRGAYDPNPHLAYLGAPVGRGGEADATIPGMIVRQAWLSINPRPAFANK